VNQNSTNSAEVQSETENVSTVFSTYNQSINIRLLDGMHKWAQLAQTQMWF